MWERARIHNVIFNSYLNLTRFATFSLRYENINAGTFNLIRLCLYIKQQRSRAIALDTKIDSFLKKEHSQADLVQFSSMAAVISRIGSFRLVCSVIAVSMALLIMSSHAGLHYSTLQFPDDLHRNQSCAC